MASRLATTGNFSRSTDSERGLVWTPPTTRPQPPAGQHSLDQDARGGYRSGKGLRSKETFLGYDLHITVPVPEPRAPPLPHVALGLVTTPAGSGKAEAGLRAVDALTATGTHVGTLLADRGYTYRKPEAWALHLVGRGITSIHDLHSQQFGVHPGPHPRTIWVDSSLYTSALPEHLRRLGGFSLGMTDEQKRELQAKYDQRRPYQLDAVPHGDRTRTMRFRGPALKNRLRCPNTPQSMRAPYSVPTTRSTTAASRSRAASPASTARSRTTSGSPSRSSEPTSDCCDWHICRSMPDPWMALIGDSDDPDWGIEHARIKSRRKRKRAFHEAYYASRGRPPAAA